MVVRSEYTQCTFNVDNELARMLPGIIVEMKQKGYKRFSKTLVINAMARYFVDLHKKGDLDTIKKLMAQDYQKLTGMQLDGKI